MNPRQLLFIRGKYLMPWKSGRCYVKVALCPPSLQSCGSTWSRGMKSSCCRQSQPGFARREVNLEASSWQFRRILQERGGVIPALSTSQPARSPGRVPKASQHSTPVLESANADLKLPPLPLRSFSCCTRALSGDFFQVVTAVVKQVSN